MPILNPRRVLTRSLQEGVLAALWSPTLPGPLSTAKVFAVTAATISADTRTVESVTLGVQGLQTGRDFGQFGDAAESQTGKVYGATEPLLFATVNPTAAQTVIGVMVGPDNNPANAQAFLEFDEAVTFDENTEKTYVCIEAGFDGQEFYMVPRVMPLGM